MRGGGTDPESDRFWIGTPTPPLCGFRGSGPAPPAATRAAADGTVYSNEILGHRLGAFGRSAHRADSFTGTWPKMSVLAGSGAGPGGRESQNSTRRGRESRISATSPKTLEKLSFLDILNWSSFSFGPLPVQWRVRRTVLANARAKLRMEVAGGERGGARKCRREFWAAGMGCGRRQGWGVGGGRDVCLQAGVFRHFP